MNSIARILKQERCRLGLTISFLLLFLCMSASAYAEAIWTTSTDCGASSQNENHYGTSGLPEDSHLYINGSGWAVGTYNWSIKGNSGPDKGNDVAWGTLTINGNGTYSNTIDAGSDGETAGTSVTNIPETQGTFCIYAYHIELDDGGTYQVKVDNKGDNFTVGDTASILNPTLTKTGVLLTDADNSSSITPGDVLRYTINFSFTKPNNGPPFAYASIVDDYDETILDINAPVAGGGGFSGANVAGGVITWGENSFTGGSGLRQGTLNYDATVLPGPGGDIVNTATLQVRSGTGDPEFADDIFSIPYAVLANGTLRVNKYLNGECDGETFTINVYNSLAQNVGTFSISCSAIEDGAWAGFDLPPGTYTVSEAAEDGWLQIWDPVSQSVVVTSGQTSEISVTNTKQNVGLTINKTLVSNTDITPQGQGTYVNFRVVYDITITNTATGDGALPINQLSVIDDLSATFGAATGWSFISASLQSGPAGFELNGWYNGTNTELVNQGDGGEILLPGQSATIRVTVDVTPGTQKTYINAATGCGMFGAAAPTEICAEDNVQLRFRSSGVTSIPTLSEWGMIILSLLMAGTAVVYLKRKNDMTV